MLKKEEIRTLHILNDRFKDPAKQLSPGESLCGKGKRVGSTIDPIFSMKGLLREPPSIRKTIESGVIYREVMCKECEEHEDYPYVILAALS